MANFNLLVSTSGLIFSLFFVTQFADAIKDSQQINEFEQVNQVNLLNDNCHRDHITFELVTGYVFTSPEDTLSTMPVILKLTDCLNFCRKNSSCKAVNFETGYCILLSSSTTEKPGLLSPSQFPVFTIYAEKVCLRNLKERSCPKSWSFEKVIGYEMRNHEKKRIQSVTRERCLESCLQANDFECRSVNYNNVTGDCSLSNIDRHALGATVLKGHFSPAGTSNVDYYESNCVQEPTQLCDFKAIKGKVLKTVDSVHQDISSAEECQKTCLNANYRCFSYDFGDPSDGRRVCRTSHLDSSSLTHIEDPYVMLAEAITYQRQSCFNVSIQCKAKEMVASIKTNKLFSGKIYAKSKPNSCVTDVTNSLNFDLAMGYHDLVCDVKQKDAGKFVNDLVIQHHDMVVTTKDLGLAINCNYDLTNKSVSNINSLNVDGDLETREEEAIHSASVGAPNITMSITDRQGNPIKTAQVGDSLSLRVEITDRNTPYQIFIRELVAVDGVDTSDIMLIDSAGCPTDVNIMGFVSKPVTEKSGVANSRILEIPFDAFKFPTSDIVQFRALVTPCLHACEPIVCVANNYDGRTLEQKSYGRRRRRSIESNFITSANEQSQHSTGSNSAPKSNEEELVLVQSIKILDSFEQAKNKRKGGRLSALESGEHLSEELDQVFSEQVGSGCVNVAGLIMICSMFLLVQLLLIVFWSICWMRRNQQHNSSAKLLVNGLAESGLQSPYSAFTSSNSSLHSTGKLNSRCLPSLTNAQSTCSSAFAKNHR